MKCQILTVGKAHDKGIKEAIEDYTKRLHNSLQVEWTYISHSQKEKESTAILSKIKREDCVIVLDEKGTQMTSLGLSEYISEKMIDGTKRIIFVIGGAYGVTQEVLDRAQHMWCLSKLTFPHMLVRLVLIEQLYRAMSISEGGKYHHE